MNITKYDMTILVVTFLAVGLMTFTMPALGLAGDEAQANDIPEFQIEEQRFDIVGDLPDRPNGPNSFTIKWDEEKGTDSPNQGWWYGDTDNGLEIVLINDGNVSDPAAKFFLNEWDNGSIVQDENATITEEGGYAFLETQDGSWQVQVEVHRFENVGESDMTIIAEGTTLERETNDNWIFAVIGQVWATADHVAGVTAWGVTVILFWIITGFEIMLNALGMVFDTMSYFVGLFTWLIDQYTTIATAGVLANWAKVLLLTPLVLLMGELAKLVVIIVHVIWIG